GETTWADNENIIDAYLLNTKRIGHGFNLVAYPEVEQGLRENGVALEVCPISNQMLRYLGDPRLHPAMGYIRRDVPCVLASDDPMIFGNHGLSYDFWMAWMAWDLSLDDMRVLAGNSLLYSGMPPREKAAAIKRWQRKWAEFERSLAAR
ncbi:MAG: adenosine kinase, partial [Planctomycetota bacterium]